MIRRLTLPWPASGDMQGQRRRRLLAVSDDRDPGLAEPAVRSALLPVDLIVGCGDLEPDYLAMLGDAFLAPLVYIRGNHDRGIGWREHARHIPDVMPDARPIERADLQLAGLSWPGAPEGRAVHDGRAAWRQSFALATRTLRRDTAALVMVSHVPPHGLGDAADPYHQGFSAYRWLVHRLRPRLWLHGHTHPASRGSDVEVDGTTTVVNVTAAILIELVLPTV